MIQIETCELVTTYKIILSLTLVRKIFVLTLLTVCFYTSRASWDVLFCTNTDSLGNCKGKGETFSWNGDKTPIELIVLNKDGLGLEKLRYMIFNMKTDREGKLYADLSLTTRPKSLFAVKRIYFYKPGYYKVDVLDEKDNFLTTGFITISDRPEQ